MPRWVKVFLIIAAVVVVAMIAVMVATGGRHGPGRHLSSARLEPGATDVVTSVSSLSMRPEPVQDDGP
jgi:hypothetical protein